ncbi:MAG: 50S ribosomal protein L16 [Verrucomicrobiota bacterium]
MPLMPKRTKFRKAHRGSRSGNAQTGTTVAFGDFGLQTLDRAWMTNRQIEACRIAINRSLKRKGKVWIRIFPHKPITSRPPEVRMGKGKGAVEGWVAVIRPGNVLFEVGGVAESAAKEAMRLASYKLGIRTRLITRNPHA